MIRPGPESVELAYSGKGKANALSPASGKQLVVFNARAKNNSGSSLTVGLMKSLSSTSFKLYLLTTGGTVYTLSSSATSAQVFTTTNNDGFIFQAPRRFGLLGMTVSSAGAGGTFTFQYYNGSAFTTLTTIENPADYSTTGDKYIVFRPPYDWAVGGSASINPNMYAIQVIGSTAPGSAVSISSAWCSEFLDVYSGIANNSGIQLSFPNDKPLELNATEGLHPYFSTANAANTFGCFYANIG